MSELPRQSRRLAAPSLCDRYLSFDVCHNVQPTLQLSDVPCFSLTKHPPVQPAQVHPPEAAAAEHSPAGPPAEHSSPAEQDALRAASADMAYPAAARPQAVHADAQIAEPYAEEQLTDAYETAPAAAAHQAAEQLGGPPALHRGGMGGTGSEWIACDECGKWRQAAVGDVARGPWTCANNTNPRCHHRSRGNSDFKTCRARAQQDGQWDCTLGAGTRYSLTI